MSGIYDDGATYGPDPTNTVNEPQTDPIYDDGDVYGQPTTRDGAIEVIEIAEARREAP
ncbi:hypothetical protein [Streptomyces californicus]|uniref:hypothetical protein n=1 Tax=Streptomyces californicus TaxID=67351 RepID=UPI0036873810